MPDTPRKSDRILRKPEVLAKTGLSNNTIARLEAAGRFPVRRRISPRAVGWVESEVDAWIARRATAAKE